MTGETVRPAQPDDVEGIHRVMRQSRQTAFADLLSPDALEWGTEAPDEFGEWVKSAVSNEEAAVLVALRDETVVGIAKLDWGAEATRAFVDEAEAELDVIHVAPDHWGEGVGTHLLSRVVETLPSRLTGIALGVLVGNDRARGFYERRGFEHDGTTTITIAGDEYTEAVYRRST